MQSSHQQRNSVIHCGRCGLASSESCNFCRSCGAALAAQANAVFQPAPSFEYAAPKPYSWKTDDYYPEREEKPKVPFFKNFRSTSALQTSPDLAIAPARSNVLGFSYACPRCGSRHLPQTMKRISTAGWVTFGLLLAFAFPLFWIGFLIREEYGVCPECKYKLD